MLELFKKVCIIVSSSRSGGNRSQSHRLSRVQSQLATTRIIEQTGFLFARANGCATTRISDNRLTPYTDEPLYEPRWRGLMQGITKTGKMVYRIFSSQYERLIIELHRLADSRLRLAITGSKPSCGSVMLKGIANG